MTNNLTTVTPTWVTPVEERYNVNISPSEYMKRDYYLFSTTPNLQYKLEFSGLSEESYQILLQHWRDVSGTFGAFNWYSIPKNYLTNIIRDRVRLTTLEDRTSFNNDVTVSGTSICKGQNDANWALDYDGVNDFSGATCSSDAWSYTAWVNPKEEETGGATAQILISKCLGVNHGLYLDYASSPNRFGLVYEWSGGTVSTAYYDIASYNQWYFLVGTYSPAAGSLPLLYVNGSNVATGAILNDITPTTMQLSSVSIGGGISGRYTNSMIGGCRIYNRELSAASISTLNSGGSITGGLIGRWDCNDVSMYGRWASQPEIKIDSRSWGMNIVFEKDLE